jgi:D-alanyl-D-alanine carboxypeptidase
MTHASWTAAELVDLIGPPDFAAGAQYEYTNSNYLLLGLIDERAGGRPINELLHSYLWDPLGLDRTYYAGPETIPEPLAHGYNLGPNGPVDLYDGSGILPSALEASAARTAGAVASTASDVARWMFLLYSGQVLSPSSQQQLLDFGQTPTYGLGVMRTVLEDAGLALGHEGQMPGYRTAGYFIRDTGVVLVVLTNQTDFDTAGILGRLLGALPG